MPMSFPFEPVPVIDLSIRIPTNSLSMPPIILEVAKIACGTIETAIVFLPLSEVTNKILFPIPEIEPLAFK